jgi:4-alpha-glucanotransferase
MAATWLTRSAGIILHPTSLPGRFGIGDLGPAAHTWIDTLAKTGITWWQVLPLGPTGQGDSPYSCFSAFAGNPLLVSPELLVRDGLITTAALENLSFPADRVDYENVHKFKDWILAQAFRAFREGKVPTFKAAFDQFRHEHAGWLDEFALYTALKHVHGGGDWREWPTPLVRRDAAALTAARSKYADIIDLERFRQFIFFRQWTALRQYAAERGVKILGDAPIFVAADSADVWSRPELFLLDDDHKPRVVAGVPPDYFSETGQLWGNPLYDWVALEKTGYRWWIDRVRAGLELVDMVRLDHFRGFEAAWHVPADAKTAVDGKWVPGPGIELFRALKTELGGLPLVAEDLGVITKEVEKLREETDLPGMRVLQFAFGGDPTFKFLPHNFDPHTVVYTGTHDNDTTLGWFATIPEGEKKFLKSYWPRAIDDPAGELIRMAWASVAAVAIAPLQDVLALDTTARMNVPGRADGNWTWRMSEAQMTSRAFERLTEWTHIYNRKMPLANATDAPAAKIS